MKKSRIIFILIILMIMLVIPYSFAIDYTTNDDLNLAEDELILDSVSEDGIAVSENIEDSILDENSNPSSNLGADPGQIKTNVSDSTYNDLQSAINSETGEFTVLIGEGTYTNAKSGSNDLTTGQANTNLTISKKAINFVGAGSDKTFIDGTDSDWFLNITDSNVTFKGMSFINGFTNSTALIYGSESHISFINCSFENNRINTTRSIYGLIYFDGAYWIKNYTLTVDNSNFTNNRLLSSYGNGHVLYIDKASSNISNSYFAYESPYTESGGIFASAIYVQNSGILTYIDNCVFVNFSDDKGGSIKSSYGGNLTILNSRFVNSTATIQGAAIYSIDFPSVTLTLSNNIFENCKLADGTEENIYYEGVRLVELGSNATISVNSTEVIEGEDNLLAFAVCDNENNPLDTELEITLTSSKNSFTRTVQVDEGIGSIELKDIPAGIYTLAATLKDDNYTASIARAIVKIRKDYDYALIFNPLNATLYEGQPYYINGTVVDCYGEATRDLNGVKVSCQWETTGGSVHSRTSLGFIDGSSFSYDISDLALVPRKVYDVIFILNYESEGRTVQNGHFYANLIEKLPEGLVDLDIIHVDAARGSDETGNGNETNPVKSLDVALNINTYLGGGKTIILKEGNYNISTYTIKNDVTVVGEDPSKVIISQPSGNKGMFFINEGLNVEFNNVTFANAYTTVMPYGAVFSNYYVSTLIVNNSVFHDNKGWYGGAINNNDQGTVIIDNCDFHNNSAYYAGVLSASEGHVFIYNSNFTDNKAQFDYENKSVNGTGGALLLYSASDDEEDINLEAYISNCNFINNSAPGDDNSEIGGGGAIAISAIGTVTICNSSFIDNHAGRSGGAIWAVHGNIDITGCEFINNTARAGSAIAAYRNNDTIVNVSNSVILTDDINTEVIYVSDESESVVYANNNWWGSNSAPNVANTNISSRILLKFYNDEDYNLVVAFVTGDGTIFNDYLPARTLVLAPESEFEQTVFQLGGNVNSIVLEYSGEIETAVLNATVDGETVIFKYRHYPEIDSLIESEDMVAVLGDTITITANVTSDGKPLDVGIVYFYIDDNYIGECEVVDGTASITYAANEKGVFEIGIDYTGDDYYKPYSLNKTLTVTIQIPTSIVASDALISVGDSFPIRLISSDNSAPVANKGIRVEVILNKIEDYIATSESIANLTKFTDNDGFIYIDLEEGNYTLNISFLEESDYMASSNTANVIVSKSSTRLDIIQNENTGDITIRLSSNDNGLADKLVKVLARSVTNQSEYDLTTNEKGYAFISLTAGNYYIYASFEEDGIYLPSSSNKLLNIAVDGNGTFIANETDDNGTGDDSDNNGTADGNNSSATTKKASVIVYKNMVTSTVNAKLDGESSEYFTITLMDSDGKLLTGKTVQFLFNGRISKAATDKKGQARLKIALASKGTYYIVASFADDTSYYSSIVTARIKVNPQKVKIKVPKKTFKASKKVKKLTATLKNSKGKAIKGKKLTFIVNKKKYTAKTNKKGVATVKVKLSKKKTYKVTVKFAGDKTYKKLSKKGKVKVK